MPPKGGKGGGKSKAGEGTSTEPKVFQTRSAKAGLQVLASLPHSLSRARSSSNRFFFGLVDSFSSPLDVSTDT